jgi:hypothetical protein
MIPIHFLPSKGMGRISISRCSLLSMTLLVCVALVSVCSGQVAIPTSRSDNARSGANVNETVLTPSNVNKNQFGSIFNYPIDYQALAQPLYVPNVNINVNGQVSTHNVVYVATMADSVYAFDADTGVGLNGNPYLWWVNFTSSAYGEGITTASGQYNGHALCHCEDHAKRQRHGDGLPLSARTRHYQRGGNVRGAGSDYRHQHESQGACHQLQQLSPVEPARTASS